MHELRLCASPTSCAALMYYSDVYIDCLSPQNIDHFMLLEHQKMQVGIVNILESLGHERSVGKPL